MDGGEGMITKLRKGTYHGDPGVYWAWSYDGYYDIHHAPEGVIPDGSDVVSELHPTLADARAWVRDEVGGSGLRFRTDVRL
jgi:hypothetical protein